MEGRERKLVEKDKPLDGKVALLVNGSRIGGRQLAVSLARHGADLVILHSEPNVHFAQITKKLVTAEGSRCLLFQSSPDKATMDKSVLEKTVTSLGRLDIYIDYSAVVHGPPGKLLSRHKNGTERELSPVGQIKSDINLEPILSAIELLVTAGVYDS